MAKRKLGSAAKWLRERASEVPGMKEFRNSFPVVSGKAILQKRIDMKMNQEQLSEYILNQTGKEISPELIYRMEWADTEIPSSLYQFVLQALGLSTNQINISQAPAIR